jgi:hypothetical protein
MPCESVSVDSNFTGLRIAEEECIGQLPVAPVPEWEPQEPNSYADFGPQISTVARQPIASDRQINRGVVTDLDAQAGFQTDLTLNRFNDKLLSGFLYADWRRKRLEAATAVTATGYTVADESGFAAGDLICVEGLSLDVNNGLKIVTGTIAGEVQVAGLVAEAAGPYTFARIRKVGIEGAAGDLDVDASTDPTRPRLTSTVLDFTTLGFIPGEWVFLGGDAAGTFFVSADVDGNLVNTGFCRVFSITANELVFDKTQFTMVDEASAAETMRLFYGDVLRNEPDPVDIVQKSFQAERTLGAGGSVGWEYIVGMVPNTLSIAAATADKITVDYNFLAINTETIANPGPAKTGNRPDLTSETAFNTSSDFSRLRFLKQDLTGIEQYLTELNLEINNNAEAVKALCALGAVDVNTGFFQVSGTFTALFTTTESLDAVRNNEDATLDFALVKENEGLLFDVMSLTLGDGRLNVELNTPITIPFSYDAARSGEPFGHTLLLNKFACLPDRADTLEC